MSTSALTGKPVNHGPNSDNGTTVTAQPNYATNFVASPVIASASYPATTAPAVTAQPVYTGMANGSTVTAQPSYASGFVASPATGSNPPTYNPGS